MPSPRRNVRSTPDGGSAVQPPGLSCTAYWEALCCALCLLTTPEISGTGPVRGRGICPGSRRPRARVSLVVWAWDLFCMGFFHCGLPAPALPLFSLCALRLFITKQMFLFLVLPSRQGTVDALTQAVCIKKQHHAGAMVLETNLMHDRPPLNQFIRKSPLSS